MVLEELFTVRSSRDICHKELDLNMELAVCLNEVHTTEAIRQAKLHGTITPYTLQKAHQENVLTLECQVMEEERQACQAFVEAFRVAMGSCSPKIQGALLYPLQLLTGGVLVAALLRMSATTQLWVMKDEKPAPTAPIQECQRCQHHQWALMPVPFLRQRCAISEAG